jgi:methionyl-tRNA formyltransferase
MSASREQQPESRAAESVADPSTVERLRVYFITEDDPLYVIRFFDTFFAEYPRDEFDLLGVTIADPFRESRVATAKRMFGFYGIRDFGRLLMRFSSAIARGHSIGALARRETVQVVTSRSVNDAAHIDALKNAGTDVVVSVAAPEIFGAELLRAPRLAAINVHSGRLPEYRGMMPTFWQMLNGESAVTVTVHEMAETIDGGRILATEECAVRECDSLDRLMGEGKVIGARMVIRTLRELAAGRASSTSIDVTAGTYRSFPKRSDVRAFRARGYTLL